MKKLLLVFGILGIVLRLYNITEHEINMYDEATILLEAENVPTKYQWFFDNVAYLSGKIDRPNYRFHEPPEFALARPFFIHSVAVVSRITGGRDFDSHIVSMIWGIFIPVLIFFIAKKLDGPPGSAELAAAYAFVSPFLLNYSHLGLPESQYIFMHLLYLFFMIDIFTTKGLSSGRAFCSGLVAALVLLTHLKFVMPFAISLCGMFFWGGKDAIRKIVLVILGILVPVFVLHFHDYVSWRMAQAIGMEVPLTGFGGYIDEVFIRVKSDGLILSTKSMFTNLVYFVHLEHLMLFMTVLGAAFTTLQKSHRLTRASLFLLFCLMVNLLVILFTNQKNFHPSKYLRNLTSLFPFYVLISGIFISLITSHFPKPALSAAVLLTVFFAFNATFYNQVTHFTNGYKNALQYFSENHGGYTSDPTIGKYYMGRYETDFPFSPHLAVKGNAFFFSNLDRVYDFGFTLDKDRAADRNSGIAVGRDRVYIIKRIPKSQGWKYAPLSMENGIPLKEIEESFADPQNGFFYIGRIEIPEASEKVAPEKK
ncbi:MAG: hypothetical protein JKX97_02175 [Candidatus Lindowbacteria bacterium]|nr:hypothetical protein [Candidatus Lindowbacteria bacterium]